MGLLGVAPTTILLSVAFGGMESVILGSFGMGSFLVIPALMLMGYDSSIVVGERSGLRFRHGEYRNCHSAMGDRSRIWA